MFSALHSIEIATMVKRRMIQGKSQKLFLDPMPIKAYETLAIFFAAVGITIPQHSLASPVWMSPLCDRSHFLP